VLDASGNVMDGYSKDECNELKGVFFCAIVTWKDKKELPETKDPLQIRFVLQDASLYSFAAPRPVCGGSVSRLCIRLPRPLV
jgi:hypothetical protein